MVDVLLPKASHGQLCCLHCVTCTLRAQGPQQGELVGRRPSWHQTRRVHTCTFNSGTAAPSVERCGAQQNWNVV